MTAIVTLTMNPAVDLSMVTDRVVPVHKLRCDAPRLDPGGGGLNVARAIRELGGRAKALYPAGGATGRLLRELLDAAALEHEFLPIAGRTRENITVGERGTGVQYRFVLPGPTLAPGEWAACLERLTDVPAGTYLVASGSLPPGVPDDFYGRVAKAVRNADARLVLDTSGSALRAGVDAGVHLVKPNLRELAQLAGSDLHEERDQERLARDLVRSGRAEVVVLSLGAAGVLLVTADLVERIRAPVVPIQSRVGAGDCTVAGIVLGLSRGDDLRHAIRRGVAAGAAAVMTPGTELCRRADAERLYAQLLGESADAS